MQAGFTLADLWHSSPIHPAVRLQVHMRLDRRSEGWSIARSRVEVSAGQTDRSGAKPVMTLAEAIETARIHSVAGLTGDCTA
jgi:hypothetical protein